MQRRNSISKKSLSIVIPAYKQEKTIKRDLKNILIALNTTGYSYEVIIVVDGIVDNTLKKALSLRSSKVKIFSYEKNEGKGHAIQFGMMHAKGDIIGFIDAGMDIHPAGLNMLLNHMEWYSADIIVGSKLHPVSKVQYPFSRRVLSWGYRFLTKILFGFKVRDTQVGLKFFRKQVIHDVLPRLVVKKYAFDIEMLAVAYNLGYNRIYEAPIEINFNGASSITSKNFWQIIFNMLLDTSAVFYRLRIIHYYKRQKRDTYIQRKRLIMSPSK